MEKIFYLLGRPDPEHISGFHRVLLNQSIDDIRSIGGQRITIHLADQDDQIQARAPKRLLGPWENFGAAVSFWVSSEHARTALEEKLQLLTNTVHGYLVTEAVWQESEWRGEDGERRPGVCLLGGIGKKPSLTDNEFFKIWEQHSHNSFRLHPYRQSYSRHTVARCLTDDAPNYRGIILEHFPDMEVFVDDHKFFNVSEAMQINKFALSMIDETCFISGGVSEYHFV